MALGDLGKDHAQEREPGKRLLRGGEGFITDWINRYTLTLLPFTAGIVASKLVPANPLRTYLAIQNKSANTMYFNSGQNPTPVTSFNIEPGESIVFEGGASGGGFSPVNDIYILGASAGLAGVVGEGLFKPEPKRF